MPDDDYSKETRDWYQKRAKDLTLEEAAIDTDEPDVPPAGWHICACSDDCGAWEPNVEVTNE